MTNDQLTAYPDREVWIDMIEVDEDDDHTELIISVVVSQIYVVSKKALLEASQKKSTINKQRIELA